MHNLLKYLSIKKLNYIHKCIYANILISFGKFSAYNIFFIISKNFKKFSSDEILFEKLNISVLEKQKKNHTEVSSTKG